MVLVMVQALAHRSDPEDAQVTITTVAAVDAELKVGSGEATLLSHQRISSCQIKAWVLLSDCEGIRPADFHLTAALQELAICGK